MDLLVLMFVSGFALATLIFWPLLHRANQRLAESGEAHPPRGRRTVRTPAAPPRPAVTEQPADAAAEPEPAPQQPTAGPVEIPVLATDLFEKHFEAKFNRSRQRLARLRAEISKE
ncbi:hypothetical protein GCM10011581_44590 [Saccharopolyspora subtropica]|uniref:Uncharacterized protein n=1 Tax=Saccharopolyspora thermophila TaxID=89367 RepID=A0A917K7B9_9PSEU|nr:hypothetical protein [Saccharopolyspora subtropica]GGJ02553.1 hypothetical protein GCM10011581_44590 [Saccharopolyspora subtropica]